MSLLRHRRRPDRVVAPCLAGFLAATSLLLHGATASGEEKPTKVPPAHSQLFPPKVALGRSYILPTVHYSTESGFGLGAEMLYPFRFPGTTAATQISELRAKGRVTFKGETRLELESTLFWAGGKHYLKTKVSHLGTSERFYGIGPDTPESNKEVYRPRRLLAYAELFHQVVPDFKAGVRLEMEFFEFREVAPDGKLSAPQYARTTGETVFGAGVAMDWDTRDQRYSPTSGLYYQVFGMYYDDALSSDFDFTNFNVDLRNYFTLKPHHVLATQVFLYGVTNDPPFWRYASLGGRVHSRGYHRDRYLDKVLAAAQAEYRAPVFWRLSISPFAGVATVGRAVDKLAVAYLRPTVGFGLNVHYRGNSAIAARLDTAFGLEGPHFELGIGNSF